MNQYPIYSYWGLNLSPLDSPTIGKLNVLKGKSGRLIFYYNLNENFVCPFCCKIFTTIRVLTQHINHFHKLPIKHFCEICKFKFPNWKSKRNHIFLQHRPKLCKYCNEKIVINTLKHHRRHDCLAVKSYIGIALLFYFYFNLLSFI